MVIKEMGEATGKVYQKVTEGLPWPVKAGIIAGGIAGGGYLTYYFVSQLTGPSGGSCVAVGTPCNTAIQPYQATYQACANQYSQNLDQYLKEDSANGTGLTTAQLSNLNYLSNCMNKAANNIANTAKAYVPQNPLTIVSYFAGIAIVTAVGLYFGAKAVSILRASKNFGSGINNGFQAQQAMNDAGVQTDIENGTISTDEASGLNNQYGTITQDNINYSNQQIQGYLQDEIITSEEASTITEETTTAMEDDAAVTEDDLTGIFE